MMTVQDHEQVPTSETEALRFLRYLWTQDGDEVLAEHGGVIVLFELPDATAHPAPTLGAAAVRAVQLAGERASGTSRPGRDVYLTVGAVRPEAVRPGPKGARGGAADVVAVAAAVVDLDVQLPDRKKSSLFESVEEAAALLESLVLRPSLVVFTGGGLQGWWFYREAIDTRDPAGRELAERASRSAHAMCQQAAARRGRRIDSVHDLARVMRLPGTVNCKRDGIAVPVRIRTELVDPVSKAHVRYNPSELIDAAPPVDVSTLPPSASVVGNLVLNPNANPPLEKFEALKANDSKFAASWEHRRRDMKDDSLSAYDLSLASIAVRVGWDDQEIADLMIAHRRKHAGDLKLRERYYEGTIRTAKANLRMTQIESELASSGADPRDSGTRAKALDYFSQMTNAVLERVVVYLPARRTLTLFFKDRPPCHTTQAALNDWSQFFALLQANGFLPRTKRPTQDKWLNLTNVIYQIAEEEEVEQAGPVSVVAALCLAMARQSGIDVWSAKDSSEDVRAAALERDRAFMRDGLLWVKPSGLSELARDRRLERHVGDVTHIRAVLVNDLKAARRVFSARLRVGGQRPSGGKPAARQVGGAMYGVKPEQLRNADPDVTPEQLEASGVQGIPPGSITLGEISGGDAERDD